MLSQLKSSPRTPLFTERRSHHGQRGRAGQDRVLRDLQPQPRKERYQEVLETINVKRRLERVLRLLQKEMEVLSIQRKIQNQINEKIDKQQREFFLREQPKAIRSELGVEDDERSREVREWKKKAEEAGLRGEAKEKIEEEMEKLAMMDVNSAEYSVTRNYIEIVLALPWNKTTVDSLDINRAEKILNHDHYALDDVKKRILEFLAVRKLKPDARGSIICLVGLPAWGRPRSASRSRARSTRSSSACRSGHARRGRDQGHRRTYIGAMPGKITRASRSASRAIPLHARRDRQAGAELPGRPASALLEVLDPEQNVEFRDHYLDVPFDLSGVFFITTANTLDTIPQVLVDRMEVIRLSGYITEEKYEIARRYLVPKQVERHGLPRGSIKIDKSGFLYIINSWAREAGVRNLERQIERICRKTAATMARTGRVPRPELNDRTIRDYLGPRYTSTTRSPRPTGRVSHWGLRGRPTVGRPSRSSPSASAPKRAASSGSPGRWAR